VEDTNILQLGQHLKLEIGMKIKSLKLNMATNYSYRFCRLAHRHTSNKSGLTAALQAVAEIQDH
jgi:hypothetical protein